MRIKPENSACITESIKGSKFHYENRLFGFGMWAMTLHREGAVVPEALSIKVRELWLPRKVRMLLRSPRFWKEELAPTTSEKAFSEDGMTSLPKNYIFPESHIDFLDQCRMEIPTNTAVIVTCYLWESQEQQACVVSCPSLWQCLCD